MKSVDVSGLAFCGQPDSAGIKQKRVHTHMLDGVQSSAKVQQGWRQDKTSPFHPQGMKVTIRNRHSLSFGNSYILLE